MNIKILLFALSAAAISSCSTAYRSGQTPDDVYYSPARVVEENVRQERQEVKKQDFEEREIRMAIYDRRYRDFNDDYDYRYDPYTYGYSYGYYYNPYYCHYPVYITNVVIKNPKNTVPRMTNLGSYNNTSYAISNNKFNNSTRISTTPRQYNNSNNNNSLIRRILTTPSSTNNNSTETRSNDTRSYTPSSTNSSSGSSGGSSTPVTRPARGG